MKNLICPVEYMRDGNSPPRRVLSSWINTVATIQKSLTGSLQDSEHVRSVSDCLGMALRVKVTRS